MMTKSLTAALVLAMIPAMGMAQDGPRESRMPQFDFAAADADSSGGISYPEFTAYLQAQFETRRAEALGARADSLIAAGDTDGDGALTRDELIAGMQGLADERRAQMQERRDERREARGERGDRRGMWGHGHGRGMRGHGGEHGGWGRGFDPERMANRMFDRIDSDNDGQISPDEAQTAQERMQQRMERRQGRRGDR